MSFEDVYYLDKDGNKQPWRYDRHCPQGWAHWYDVHNPSNHGYIKTQDVEVAQKLQPSLPGGATMRKSVVVEGVTVSREAILKAYQEINQPEPVPVATPGHLTRMRKVKGDAMSGVLLIGSAQHYYVRGFGSRTPMEGKFTVVGDDGCGYTYTSYAELARFWAPAPDTSAKPVALDPTASILLSLTRRQAGSLLVALEYVGGSPTLSRRGDTDTIKRWLRENYGITGNNARRDVERTPGHYLTFVDSVLQ